LWVVKSSVEMKQRFKLMMPQPDAPQVQLDGWPPARFPAFQPETSRLVSKCFCT
jgi:hypothetical protein